MNARGVSRPGRELGRVVLYVDRIIWLKQVQADRTLPPSALSVALTIVDHVDPDGEAFPSQPTIAKATGLNVRAVRRATDAMATRGHLAIKVTRGRSTFNRYVPLWRAEHERPRPSAKNAGENRTERAGFEPDEEPEKRTERAGFRAGKPDNPSKKTGHFEHEKRLKRAAYQDSTRNNTPDDAREGAHVVCGGLPDDALRARMVDAACGNVEADSPGIRNLQPVRAWMAEGFDLDRHILPAVAGLVAPYKDPLRTWRAGWLRDEIRRQAAAEGNGVAAPKPADAGPTVPLPGSETRWPADAVQRWAARWWNDRRSWPEQALGETPDRPDPHRSPEFQSALDAGLADIAAASAGWPGTAATWDVERLGPRLDSLASRLAPRFAEGVPLRSGLVVTVAALHRALDDGELDEDVFGGPPSRPNNPASTLSAEWQVKALEYRAGRV